MTKNILAKSIRRFYTAKLFPATLFLAFVIYIWFNYPFMEIFFPDTVSSISEISGHYYSEKEFIKINPPTLYYTGYDYARHNDIKGSYYYTFINDKCVFFLLSPETSDSRQPELAGLSINGRLLDRSDVFEELLEHVSEDLSWTPEGLNGASLSIVISEIDYYIPESMAFLVLLSFSSLIALYFFISRLIFSAAPYFSPACTHLRRSKSGPAMLLEANEEFLKGNVFTADSMFLTDNYLIELSRNGIAVIPFEKIIWLYKHSVMTRFLWFHPRLTYTLRIVSPAGSTNIVKKDKADVDKIISKIHEASPDALIGFSEENRKIVKAKLQASKKKVHDSRQP